MAFKINIGGIEVTCDSPEEAIALTQKLSAAAQSVKPVSQPIRKPAIVQPAQPELPQFETKKPAGFDLAGTVRNFLVTIEDAGQAGADGERLAAVLGLRHPKALGGRLALINKKVLEDGFRPEDLYRVVRDSSTDHQRRWYAGPKLDGYLAALELV